MSLGLFGIDYASVDGNKAPAVQAAIAAGCAFVIQRGTWGPAADPHLARDRAAWNKAGVPFGAYLILRYPSKFRTVPSPEAQVQSFVDAYGPRRAGELPVSLDIEFGETGGRTGTVLSARQATEFAERAAIALRKHYGVIMVYTSARVWKEDLLNWPSSIFGLDPLWIKTGYYYNRLAKPDTTRYTPIKELPVPWRRERAKLDKDNDGDVDADDSLGAGAWIHQIQGDSKGLAGFTSTVDINLFLVMQPGERSSRVAWVQEIVGADPDGDYGAETAKAVKAFQKKNKLLDDAVIGPKTFVALCAARSAEIIATL